MKKINISITFPLALYICICINSSVTLADDLASSNLDSYGIKSENEAKKDFERYCKDSATKRGILDNAMYNNCYEYESSGYFELIYTLKNNQYPWLSKLLPKIIKSWTKRGVTQWRMVNFDVETEIDAYLDVKYMKEHQESSIQKINSCYYIYKEDENVWNMTRHCIQNQHF